MSRLDNRAYYDDFAGWYERERHLPYHRMLDDLEVEIVERYARASRCSRSAAARASSSIASREFAAGAQGIDLSGGMLAKAAERGLAVAQASATELPIATASVDVAYSFKVLAHIPDIAGALREMARVVRPGGYVIAEFYNARSLRRLVKALKPPTAVSAQHARRARLHALRRRSLDQQLLTGRARVGRDARHSRDHADRRVLRVPLSARPCAGPSTGSPTCRARAITAGFSSRSVVVTDVAIKAGTAHLAQLARAEYRQGAIADARIAIRRKGRPRTFVDADRGAAIDLERSFPLLPDLGVYGVLAVDPGFALI